MSDASHNDTDLSTVDEGGVAAMRDGETYPCGGCGREVKDDDEAIFCESGCEQWYHSAGCSVLVIQYIQRCRGSGLVNETNMQCTGMSELAYNLLTTEDSAEWVCDKCVTTKYIPTVRMVSTKS